MDDWIAVSRATSAIAERTASAQLTSRELCLGCPRRDYGHALGVHGQDSQTNASTLALRRDVDAMLGASSDASMRSMLCLEVTPMHWVNACVGSVIKAPRVDLWRWASGGPPAGTPLGPPPGARAPRRENFPGNFPGGRAGGGAPGAPPGPPGDPVRDPPGDPILGPPGEALYIY